MKIKSKVFVCAVTMFSLVLAGCQLTTAQPSESDTVSSSSQVSEVEEMEVLEIKWMGFNQQGILPVDGSIIQKEFEEKYKIKITNIPVDAYNKDQMALQLATGVDFDVWTWATKDVIQAEATGLVRSIPDGYLEEYAPTFVSTLDGIFENWKTMASVDGEIYSIPLYSSTYLTPLTLSVRTDWLEALNVTTLPTTLDELEALLLRFHTEDPDKNGVTGDTYALGKWWNTTSPLFTAAYVFAAYGCSVERWNIDDDGTPIHWAIMDEYKEGLKRVQQWYAKGIIHPEVVTDTRVETTEKILSNKIGGVFGTDWFIVGNNGNPSTPFGALANADPTADAATLSTFIPPVTGPDGNAVTTQFWTPLAKNYTFYFGKNASDEIVQRLLTMFDDTLADKDQFTMMWFGLEGEQFDYNADGFVVQKEGWGTTEKMAELGSNRYFIDHAFMTMDYMKLAYPKYRYDAFEAIIDYDVEPIHLANAFNTAADAEYTAAIEKIQNEFFLKAMMGEVNIDADWATYVAQWLAAGGQQITDSKKAIAVEMGLND